MISRRAGRTVSSDVLLGHSELTIRQRSGSAVNSQFRLRCHKGKFQIAFEIVAKSFTSSGIVLSAGPAPRLTKDSFRNYAKWTCTDFEHRIVRCDQPVVVMAKILFIEDSKELLDLATRWLISERHLVDQASSGEEGLALLQQGNYDLLILDWELPGISGLDVLENYRQSGGRSPALFLTARKNLPDKSAGFQAGADDYLTKPFHLEELIMRVDALLRRPHSSLPNVLKAGWLVLDRNSLRVTSDGNEIYLARMEFSLLEFFLRNQGQIFSPEELLMKVWQADSGGSPLALRTCIKKLRAKIDKPGYQSPIKNVHGSGYKFELLE